MKTIFFAVGLLAIPLSALAETYSPSQAAAHIGESATVEGTVSQVHIDDRSGVGFIDMGGRYPNQSFQGFVPRSSIGRIGDLSRLEGRTVGITGAIRDYKGIPEIVVTDPSQLRTK